MIIGKTVTFVRYVPKHGSHEKIARQWTGKVLDRYRDIDKVDGKSFTVDKYLVELNSGVLGHFLCTEAASILPEVEIERRLT